VPSSKPGILMILGRCGDGLEIARLTRADAADSSTALAHRSAVKRQVQAKSSAPSSSCENPQSPQASILRSSIVRQLFRRGEIHLYPSCFATMSGAFFRKPSETDMAAEPEKCVSLTVLKTGAKLNVITRQGYYCPGYKRAMALSLA
jgi:hypothetical protein